MPIRTTRGGAAAAPCAFSEPTRGHLEASLSPQRRAQHEVAAGYMVHQRQKGSVVRMVAEMLGSSSLGIRPPCEMPTSGLTAILDLAYLYLAGPNAVFSALSHRR